MGVPEATPEGEMMKKILCFVISGSVGFLVMGCCRTIFPSPWGIAIGVLGALVSGYLIGRLSIRMGVWDWR